MPGWVGEARVMWIHGVGWLGGCEGDSIARDMMIYFEPFYEGSSKWDSANMTCHIYMHATCYIYMHATCYI